MCGIWFCFGTPCKDYETHFLTLKSRGPEETRILPVKYAGVMGFHRLAINGVENGSQPMKQNGVYWMCNGEIYNWKELGESKSQSDCEVIGELYEKYGTKMFQLLDGVFAIIIVDTIKKQVIVARDPFGVRPLFMGDNKYLSSEIKGISFCKDIQPFAPGTFRVYSYTAMSSILTENSQYFKVPYLKNPHYSNEELAVQAIRTSLEEAVEKRLLTERPVACLLSGGVDSSIITAIVSRKLKEKGLTLKTFSIGMEGSTDLAYARKVANFLQTDHTELELTSNDFLNAIPEVIRDIESYDTTTVRASVGNWLIGKYIREHSDCKVVFNGDGSDEMFGSYLYFYNAPNDIEFELETQKLLKDIHYFDVLRSDRCISSHGLEPRTPFLDRQFVQVAMSIPTSMRRPTKTQPEKYILRKAFEGYLPSEVLWRRKEAFSDGVSSVEKSWYQIIQDSIPHYWKRTATQTPEMAYYKGLFLQYYPRAENVIPYYWMPKWTNATDPSARTLSIV